jgi:hypothetical protein
MPQIHAGGRSLVAHAAANHGSGYPVAFYRKYNTLILMTYFIMRGIDGWAA